MLGEPSMPPSMVDSAGTASHKDDSIAERRSQAAASLDSSLQLIREKRILPAAAPVAPAAAASPTDTTNAAADVCDREEQNSPATLDAAVSKSLCLEQKENILPYVMSSQEHQGNNSANAEAIAELVTSSSPVATVNEAAAMSPLESPCVRQAKYERLRQERIAANQERLRAFGLAEGATAVMGLTAPKRRSMAGKKRAIPMQPEPVRRSTRMIPPSSLNILFIAKPSM